MNNVVKRSDEEAADSAEIRSVSPDKVIRIHAAEHNEEHPYVMILREVMQNRDLSFEARGMLAYLLTKPAGWEIQPTDLKQMCGRDKVYGVLSELKVAGHITATQHMDAQGKFRGLDYELHERSVLQKPLPEKPDTVLPDTANPYISNYIEEDNKENTCMSPVASAPATRAIATPKKERRKRERKPQPTDPVFDALVCGLSKSAEPTPLSRKAFGWRVGKILSGDDKRDCDGLLDYEHERLNAPDLDYAALAVDVTLFWKNFYQQHPGIDLADCAKFMGWWDRFRSAQARKTAPHKPVEIIEPDDYVFPAIEAKTWKPGKNF